MLLLKYLQLRSTFAWSLSNLVRCCVSNSLCIATCTNGWTILTKPLLCWRVSTTFNWRSGFSAD